MKKNKKKNNKKSFQNQEAHPQESHLPNANSLVDDEKKLETIDPKV